VCTSWHRNEIRLANLLTLNLLAERGDVRFVPSGFHPGATTARLRGLRLAPLTFTLVMSADHPPAPGTPSVDHFAAASHGLDSVIGRGLICESMRSPHKGTWLGASA
jgi:hypothetical protein